MQVSNNKHSGVSKELLDSVRAYIEENYVAEEPFAAQESFSECEYAVLGEPVYSKLGKSQLLGNVVCEKESIEPSDLEELLDELDAGFSETLLMLIDKSGKTDPEIYKKANVDRRLFSKIRNNKNYNPSKTTAIAFAFALELNLDETEDFIARAGYALSHSSKFDIIVEYFLLNKNYDVFKLNEVLFAFDQPLIGA